MVGHTDDHSQGLAPVGRRACRRTAILVTGLACDRHAADSEGDVAESEDGTASEGEDACGSEAEPDKAAEDTSVLSRTLVLPELLGSRDTRPPHYW